MASAQALTPTWRPSGPQGGAHVWVAQWPKRSSSRSQAATLTDPLEGLKDCGVQIEGPAAVRNYLEQHRDMVPVLVRACRLARKMMTPNAELALEVYRDPEAGDPHLTVYVRQEVYEEGIMERIEAIRELYAEELAAASGWLHLTTDFQSPRGRHAI